MNIFKNKSNLKKCRKTVNCTSKQKRDEGCAL